MTCQRCWLRLAGWTSRVLVRRYLAKVLLDALQRRDPSNQASSSKATDPDLCKIAASQFATLHVINCSMEEECTGINPVCARQALQTLPFQAVARKFVYCWIRELEECAHGLSVNSKNKIYGDWGRPSGASQPGNLLTASSRTGASQAQLECKCARRRCPLPMLSYSPFPILVFVLLSCLSNSVVRGFTSLLCATVDSHSLWLCYVAFTTQ